MFMKPYYILYGIGGAAYNDVRPEDFPGLIHRHVIFSKVHAVRAKLSDQFHMVVQKEFRPMAAA